MPTRTAENQVDRTALLDAFRRREPEAVRAMYREFGGLVYGVASRVLGRVDLAEEAVQHTFVQAWRAADRLDVTREPAPWLATIAKHEAISIHRREVRRPVSSFAEADPHDRALVSVAPDLDRVEAVWHVRRAIDALPPDEAVIVRLQHLEGMTQSEISERLDISVGTVKSRSHRAHRRLAALLGHLRDPSFA